MNIVFYVLLTMAAVYVIFNIVDCVGWWWNVVLFVPKKIWDLIKSIFNK